ncbi:MAG: TraR/DksA family transcriptional regulator [Nitrospina sp.]|nr:TraR/DksA family transcriptional regulator [Nitrospina sp.]
MVAKKKSIKIKTSSKKETKSGTNKSSSTSKVKKNTTGKVKTKAKIKTKAKPKAKIKTKVKPKAKIKTKAKPKAKIKTKAKPKAKIKTEVKKQTKRPQPKTIKSKKIETDPSTSKIRDHLEANQQELLNIIQSNQSAERKTSESNFSNEIDMASDLEGREMMFQLTSRDRNELKKIREAIYKIDHGTYGICESCLKKISSKRLKILPLSNLCIDCKEAMEQAYD